MHWAWSSRTRNGNGNKKRRFWQGDARPDFLCIGAQKAGTSWLYKQLSLHPDFWMPPVKELHYFDSLSRIKRRHPPRRNDKRDERFLKQIRSLSHRSYVDLESYSNLFKFKGRLLCGDITPAYSMLNEEIIQRIVDYFPELKVIFLARDPVERAWSQLSMVVRFGVIKPFDATNSDEVIRNLLDPAVLLRSYPSKIVARWRRYIGPDLFRVYFFDDLKKNPAGVRSSILQFLGGDPCAASGKLDPDQESNVGTKLSLSEKVRSRLAQFFKKELKACADELGGPARQWPARYGFSLLWFLADVVDDVDLFAWCDWLA